MVNALYVCSLFQVTFCMYHDGCWLSSGCSGIVVPCTRAENTEGARVESRVLCGREKKENSQ